MKQTARDNNKIDHKELNKDLAKKRIILYCFIERTLELGFNITLESHHINLANSKLIIKPYNPEFGIKVRYS